MSRTEKTDLPRGLPSASSSNTLPEVSPFQRRPNFFGEQLIVEHDSGRLRLPALAGTTPPCPRMHAAYSGTEPNGVRVGGPNRWASEPSHSFKSVSIEPRTSFVHFQSAIAFVRPSISACDTFLFTMFVQTLDASAAADASAALSGDGVALVAVQATKEATVTATNDLRMRPRLAHSFPFELPEEGPRVRYPGKKYSRSLRAQT